MSAEASNETFRTNVLAEIERIREELNKLKSIKQNLTKKPTNRKMVRKDTVKKKSVKAKPVRKGVKSKK